MADADLNSFFKKKNKKKKSTKIKNPAPDEAASSEVCDPSEDVMAGLGAAVEEMCSLADPGNVRAWAADDAQLVTCRRSDDGPSDVSWTCSVDYAGDGPWVASADYRLLQCWGCGSLLAASDPFKCCTRCSAEEWPPSHFCSVECFEAHWPRHSRWHQQIQEHHGFASSGSASLGPGGWLPLTVTTAVESFDNGAAIDAVAMAWLTSGGHVDAISDPECRLSMCTLLMIACREGCSQLVETLLESRASIDLQDGDGCSALMHASASGRATLVRRLLQVRAQTGMFAVEGDTALMLAVQGAIDHPQLAEEIDGFAECVRLIKEHVEQLPSLIAAVPDIAADESMEMELDLSQLSMQLTQQGRPPVPGDPIERGCA